jgi:F0F1-type ATP synthase assembly protein I
MSMNQTMKAGTETKETKMNAQFVSSCILGVYIGVLVAKASKSFKQAVVYFAIYAVIIGFYIWAHY